MNYHTVAHQLGLLALLLSGVMLIVSGLSLGIEYERAEHIQWAAVSALFIAGLIGLATGAGLWAFGRRRERFLGRKEALLLVSVSWFGGAVISALPFWLWALLLRDSGQPHDFESFINCYFEAMSGLTTTGATVLHDISAVPASLLLWRAFTHWLGGLGIVVLFVAVLPGLGVGGKRLFQIESPGPAPEGLQPHIRETARWLWFIYLGLTVAEVAALWAFTPMDGYEALCHTFATLATGGFSTQNASIGAYYHTPAVDGIVIVFMILAGVNFGLYYRLVRGRAALVWRDAELRVYLAILAASVLVITLILAFGGVQLPLTTGEAEAPTFSESFRQSLFTTVSIQTTTGFCTSDFQQWPFLAKGLLVLLMFIGGSSGSTAGGIKIIRIWIAFKVLRHEIEHAFRPQVVRPVRVGSAAVSPEMRLGALAYVLGIIVLFVVGSFLLMFLEQFNPDSHCDYVSAATGCAATLCNVGPGLALVGPIENYAWFSGASKLVMCLLMALGRLEVFAIVVLLKRGFWRRN